MQWTKQHPFLILNVFQAVIATVTAFGADLSQEQQAVLLVLSSSIISALVGYKVNGNGTSSKNNPSSHN